MHFQYILCHYIGVAPVTHDEIHIGNNVEYKDGIQLQTADPQFYYRTPWFTLFSSNTPAMGSVTKH